MKQKFGKGTRSSKTDKFIKCR